MKKCNPNLDKAKNPEYICNLLSGLWILRRGNVYKKNKETIDRLLNIVIEQPQPLYQQIPPPPQPKIAIVRDDKKDLIDRNIIINSFETECESRGYKFGTELSKGGYGAVKIACFTDKCEYVAKVSQLFSKNSIKSRDLDEKNQRLDAFINEVNILKKLQKYGVTPQMHDYWVCKNTDTGDLIGVIILEKMDGDIEKLLTQMIKDQDYVKLSDIYQQIASLLEPFENLQILHIDLKPGNVLYKKDKDGKLKLYLSDFGTSHDYTTGKLPWRLEDLKFYDIYTPPLKFVKGFDLKNFHLFVNKFIGQIDIDKIIEKRKIIKKVPVKKINSQPKLTGDIANWNKYDSIDTKYKLLDKLGAGNFGAVYRAIDKTTNIEVAVKIIKFNKYTFQDVEDEINNLYFVTTENCHPNVICYLDHFVSNGDLHIVTEFIEGVSMKKFALKQWEMNVSPPPFIVYKLLVDLLSGLAHLHKYNVVHRDLKLDNIMIRNSETNPQGVIVDLGLACINECKRLSGNIMYSAPEIDEYVHDKRDELDIETLKKSDVYGLGLCMYEYMSGKFLTQTEFKGDTKGWYNDDEMENIVTRMLITSPESRPSAVNLLKMLK